MNDALFVHGGKTDPFNSYSYTAAPNNGDILYLSLSASFDSSSPPWELLSISSNSSSAQGPSLSWHTLSAFNTSHVLLFGGKPGPESPTVLVGVADSAYLLDVLNPMEPLWITEPVAWANEPIRRVHHSSTTATSGSIYIIGGEKADGSNIAFSEHYIFHPEVPSFTQLPSDNGPRGITGHSSAMLPDGRLLVFGGYSQSSDSLLPLSVVWALDTSRPLQSWSLISVSNASLPSPRRAFAATVIKDGKVLIHGGSDAPLQGNFADGWILDTSVNPMAWAQVDALNQLGPRRDHFAVSYGNQVIFGFGYANDEPAPASLQIFDTDKGVFVTEFSPLPSSTTPTQTLPGASQTTKRPTPTGSSSGRGSHPSITVSPGPGDSNHGGGNGHGPGTQGSRTASIVVGTVLGVLGLLAGAYYVRRHRRSHADSERRFLTLEGSDDEGGESSNLARNIPAAGFSQDKQMSRSRQGWDFGVIGSLGLARIVSAVTGTRSTSHIPARRDMLADEDTRDFGMWYDAGRRDGTGSSSWSLRSIMGPRRTSHEPSIAGSIGEASWKEKIDPFADGSALARDEDTSFAGTARPQGRKQISIASAWSYRDPFADPIQEETSDHYSDDDDDGPSTQPYLHPIPPPLPALRTILPVSRVGHPLSPLTERTSQNTLSLNEPSNSVSSHTSLNSPFDTTSSQITSHTSHEAPTSAGPFGSSIIGATASNRPMKRSDSWWARFSRTSFLDRRPSESSRLKAMPEFRDPNPPPRLVAIEESVHSASPHDHAPKSRQPGASSGGPLPGISRHASRLQGGHNKSLTSVKTADTEAIERMAGTMDVAQLGRSDSRRTASSGATASLSIDTSRGSWVQEDAADGYGDPELMTFPSPVEMAEARFLSQQPDSYHSFTPAPASSLSPTSAMKHGSPPSSSVVAARIQDFERRQSQDLQAPPLTNTRRREERSKKPPYDTAVNYGLIPRASLFVANPDHRTRPSADS
ncbi:putative galactose oxidase, central domain [Lyophyllum shimeji]|uniref:Galactose oxidase, central domain n=1 Tax=Lyophyllum shimeji TaxID=47721 RepID=A0A9P3PRR4_LYOSH|nr:putative galactose oxidase, central domain [Lyophyllum shimeji]